MRMTESFNDRADECIRLSRRAKTAHDQELFSELAFAWCGLGYGGPGAAETRPGCQARRGAEQCLYNIAHSLTH